MTAKIVEDKKIWDKFIDDSPYGLLFHKWDFLKTIEKHTGYQLLSYGIYIGQELIALFPLFYKSIKGMKTIFSPPPGTAVPYMGFVMNKEYDNLKQNKKENYIGIVVDDIEEEIKRKSPNYVSINTVPNFYDMRPFLWHKYNVTPNYTYLIDLNRDLNDISNSFNHGLRNKIKHAEELNLEISTCKDVSVLYSLLEKRYKEQGVNIPLISKEYLEDLIKYYPKELCCICIHDKNGEVDSPLTAILLCKYKYSIDWIGGTKVEGGTNANEFLKWNLIKDSKVEGYNYFEIEGANTKNLCRHKRAFGPSLELYFIIKKEDFWGKIGEWFYLNFIRRKLM